MNLKTLLLASALAGLAWAPTVAIADAAPADSADGAAAESDFRADSALAARVQAAIAHHPSLHALPIRVAAVDGVVRLSGTVPSGVQVDIAEDVVSRVPGVKEVNNLLSPVVDS